MEAGPRRAPPNIELTIPLHQRVQTGHQGPCRCRADASKRSAAEADGDTAVWQLFEMRGEHESALRSVEKIEQACRRVIVVLAISWWYRLNRRRRRSG